ncbi:MAG: hypothetical protein H6739_12630 [Alphaproteobacteria bacterium]|nr:hypothetical protein [Alphaproteobacteria bacterium]
MAENPYAPPDADLEAPETQPFEGLTFGVLEDPLSLRRRHLSHETGLRGVGTVYMLAGGLCGLFGLSLLTIVAFDLLVVHSPKDAALVVRIIGVLVASAACCAALLWLGRGLGRLNPRVRVGVTVTSALALLWVPVGTVFGLWSLYLLYAEKGQVVFSQRYAEAREKTPQLRPRPSILGVLAVISAAAVTLLALIGALLDL